MGGRAGDRGSGFLNREVEKLGAVDCWVNYAHRDYPSKRPDSAVFRIDGARDFLHVHALTIVGRSRNFGLEGGNGTLRCRNVARDDGTAGPFLLFAVSIEH